MSDASAVLFLVLCGPFYAAGGGIIMGGIRSGQCGPAPIADSHYAYISI